ncbi:uncharacterized protein LOC122820540 [Gambusia affinis]|uniref:uncharacterized protein LOC122820540 n=1 Tax=Gambusia affinis TaxID=33528 RepID=UPI001CDD164B|nr:uncharacterized protein LOC122820540 [Gambusia affinis]
MVPFFFIHLLLMALLLQHTEEKKEQRRPKPPKHDEVLHHQEFCLSIPAAPQSIGLHFEPPQPTKLASKPKPTGDPNSPELDIPRQANRPDIGSFPMTGKENYRSSGVPERAPIIPFGPLRGPVLSIPEAPPVGCYCNEKNTKLFTKTNQVSSVTVRYPTETCRSTENIEILEDGTYVCVKQFNFFLAHFLRSLSKQVPEQRPTESAEISSTTHQSTTAETTTPTHLVKGTNGPPGLSINYGPAPGEDQDQLGEVHPNVNGPGGGSIGPDIPGPPGLSGFEPPFQQRCIWCEPTETWNNFDLKDVQLVDLTLQSSSCPSSVSVTLTDGHYICLDSFHRDFQQLLDKLEMKEP